MTQKKMEHKQFDAFVTDVQEDQGIIKAVFSVFGNVDEGYDRIHPGSFAKTFAERGHKVLVLDNHNMTSAGDAVAKVLALRELSKAELPPEVLVKYPDATGGAEITAQFEPNPANDQKSAGIFYRLKNKWIGEWSFGYDALDFDYTDENVKGKPATVRNLRTIKLYEVSPVLLGMNPATMTTGAKADKPTEGKPYRAVQEGDKWHVYKLDDNGDPIGASLDEHDSEEEANAQVRALYANEGKADEKAVMKTEADGKHPASHYLVVEDPEKVTTWHLQVLDLQGKPDHRLMGAAWAALHEGYRGNKYEGPNKQEAIRKLTALYGREDMPTPGKSADDPEEVKAGRVFSTRNANRIMAAMDLLHQALAEAGLMMEEEPEGEEYMPMGEGQHNDNGPQKSVTAPTSNGAGSQAIEAPDYLKLIEIQRLKAAQWR